MSKHAEPALLSAIALTFAALELLRGLRLVHEKPLQKTEALLGNRQSPKAGWATHFRLDSSVKWHMSLKMQGFSSCLDRTDFRKPCLNWTFSTANSVLYCDAMI